MTLKWNHELVSRIAGEVQRTRKAVGLSAAKLSDRTDALGMRITRAVISDLENGRKKTLDVPELIILARALGIPPLQLIYPHVPDGPVDVWPDNEVSSMTAAQWFSGEATIDGQGVVYIQAGHRLNYARLIDESQADLDFALTELPPAEARKRAQEAEATLVGAIARTIESDGDVDLSQYSERVQQSVEAQLDDGPERRARRVAAEIRGEVADGR